MRKNIILTLLTTLLFCTTAFAHPAITVYVDNERISFDQPPIIKDDRTLVPMRAIFQALGAEVTWIEETQTITSTKGSDTIILQIGNSALYKNGTLAYSMAVPAQIVGERTVVPLRAISEALGCEVAWDGEQYIINIYSDSAAPTATILADDGTVILSTRIDIPTSTSKYNSSFEAILKKEADTLTSAFINQYTQAAQTAYAAAKASGTTFSPYYFIGSYTITREESDYTSYFSSITQYTGGSDATFVNSHTFSNTAGKEIVLTDIVTDTPTQINAFLTAAFGTLIAESPSDFYSNATTRLATNLNQVGFYLTDTGIVFYLPPNTIAQESAGVISFALTYSF